MRKSFSPEFMAKVAVAAIKEDMTMAELSSQYKVHRTQINNWRRRALEGLTDVFRGKRDKSLRDKGKLIDELYRQIGQLKVENERLKKNLHALSISEKKKLIDWYSRYILSWRLSNSLEANFCVDALEEALEKGSPEIFNTDQGSQFTSDEFTGVLQSKGISISMDGRGRVLDNIFVERLWRSVKYEDAYIKGYETVVDAQVGLGEYFPFYNDPRYHQSLGYKTPYEVHINSLIHNCSPSASYRKTA